MITFVSLFLLPFRTVSYLQSCENNCNAGQQHAILPLCSLFTSYSCTVGTQYFMWAPLAPSKLFNCFTIAVYCRREVVTVNFH